MAERLRLGRPLETSEAIARLNELIGKAGEILIKFDTLLKTVEAEYGVSPFQRTMGYYDYDEQVAINVTTAVTPAHEFKERPVKFLWLYAQGAAIQVSLDNAVTGQSMVIPQGAIIWIQKKCRRIYGQAVAGAGTLFIWGFW